MVVVVDMWTVYVDTGMLCGIYCIGMYIEYINLDVSNVCLFPIQPPSDLEHKSVACLYYVISQHASTFPSLESSNYLMPDYTAHHPISSCT
jgi:hypothetical protein